MYDTNFFLILVYTVDGFRNPNLWQCKIGFDHAGLHASYGLAVGMSEIIAADKVQNAEKPMKL